MRLLCWRCGVPVGGCAHPARALTLAPGFEEPGSADDERTLPEWYLYDDYGDWIDDLAPASPLTWPLAALLAD